MDEYVKVVFPAQRYVRVDGVRTCKTNRVFQVEPGQHVFDLGPGNDYSPNECTCTVSDTLPTAPLIIEFKQI
ncbi:MAG: hypothetical protein HY308_14545 [Gammaproteobacteria bacterium]|nr:hypothetical protein [Gammaproteobacteria bacterium]